MQWIRLGISETYTFLLNYWPEFSEEYIFYLGLMQFLLCSFSVNTQLKLKVHDTFNILRSNIAHVSADTLWRFWIYCNSVINYMDVIFSNICSRLEKLKENDLSQRIIERSLIRRSICNDRRLLFKLSRM